MIKVVIVMQKKCCWHVGCIWLIDQPPCDRRFLFVLSVETGVHTKDLMTKHCIQLFQLNEQFATNSASSTVLFSVQSAVTTLHP